MRAPRSTMGLGQLRGARAAALALCLVATAAAEAANVSASPRALGVPESCTWPDCASSCPVCNRGDQSAASCLVKFPGIAECPVSFTCELGSCVCYSGSCFVNGECAKRECTMGARPEPFWPNEEAYKLAAFGPRGPGSDSSGGRWMLYAIEASIVPWLLISLGAAVAFGTALVIKRGPELWLCKRVPRVPVFLPVWALCTLGISISGFVRRDEFVAATSFASQEQLGQLKDDLESVLSMGQSTMEMCEQFRGEIHQVPASCAFNSMTEPMMTKATTAVDTATDSVVSDVDRLNEALQVLPRKINLLSWLQLFADIVIVWVPILPMLVQALSTILIVFVAFLSFYSPRADVAERAVSALQKYGSLAFAALILLAAMTGAMYLNAGIVAGRFCERVDDNVLGIVSNMNFVGWGGENHEQTRQDVRGAARFYVEGDGYNPLEEIITSIRTNVQTLAQVRSATLWMEKIAGMVCPALHQVNSNSAKRVMEENMTKMRDLLLAKRMWPYYDTVIHGILCQEMPKRLIGLIIFNMVIGFVMIPVLALTLDVDLKRMVAYKGGHQLMEHDPVEEEDDIEPFDRWGHIPAKSSDTYTHMVRTTVRSPRHKGQPGSAMGSTNRTFLA